MKEKYKHIIQKHGSLFAFLHNLVQKNRKHIRGRDNILSCKGVFISHTSINVTGNNNHIQVQRGLTLLDNCKFYVEGNNNSIQIDSGCKLKDVTFFIQDSNGSITIGKDTIITGQTHLAVIEGTSISIGRDCLFSQNITLRTGDSHSILDVTGKRINPSKNIIIGNHVWVGNSVIILKGSRINDNSIIATGCILTGNDYPANSVIGGIGGKVLKSDINWCEERIPIQD